MKADTTSPPLSRCARIARLELRNVASRETLHVARNMVRHRVSPGRAAKADAIARRSLPRGAMQKRSEFGPLLAILMREQPRRLVEIGRGSGGALWAFCQVAPRDATVVSVDLPGAAFAPQSPPGADELRRYAGPTQQLHLIDGDSRDPAIVARVRELAPSIDFLFIDGDHSYEGVSADYTTYAPMVCPGGLIALHDILTHSTEMRVEVDRFWSEIGGPKREITSPSEESRAYGAWGGIGLLRRQPSLDVDICSAWAPP